MLIQADARHIPLRDGCVQCVVTSPPYWGLRDYGVAGQLGLEASPDAYVDTMVAVFREVKRVLKDDGVCWLNLGDSYAQSGMGGNPHESPFRKQATNAGSLIPGRKAPNGCKPKDLLGIPWRVAFALQSDGWYLRSDIIWHKPNQMPESVTDRPTKSHEYLFLLAKSERYYYDADAIREDASESTWRRSLQGTGTARCAATSKRMNAPLVAGMSGSGFKRGRDYVGDAENGRNKRSVWTIPTMSYAGAHFATMPEALVEPCILAGSRLGDLVFDPFIGSGTVGAVAERFGRRWVGTDLNPAYHQLAKKRTAQRGLRYAEPA